MKVSDFDYYLPEALIAQRPSPTRDESRLMVIHRKERRWEHHVFRELPGLLTPGDLLVWNTTRVFPARLQARRLGKDEHVELLLVRQVSAGSWQALLKPARKAKPGQLLEVQSRKATVLEALPDGSRIVRFDEPDSLAEDLERFGTPPLPPYIRRDPRGDFGEDRTRYQTIYAREAGSVAAPTAGLHFTPEVIRELDARGITRSEVLLHIGYGTFQPVRVEEVEQHRMHPETYVVSTRSAATVNLQKATGGRVIAVGTTTTRVLEFVGKSGRVDAAAGTCDLFIYPGFEFRILDALLTNFHLPKSTLLMLVCAFAGTEFTLECYAEAVRNKYRFFSYGDCMLIF